MNTLTESLDRTLLLMRDNLSTEVSDTSLVDALTGAEIALVADRNNLSSHAAQCAYITAALLMARSGHRVYLDAPDIPLIGAQPPLRGSHLVSALLDVGENLLPGIAFSADAPQHEVPLLVVFGDSTRRYRARRAIGINATAWSGRMGLPTSNARWAEKAWPFGAMAAAALVAAEAFKVAMHRLRAFANNIALYDQLFAFTNDLNVELAPRGTRQLASLGDFDFVSGGAIANATLFALVRLPRVQGRGRVIEPERTDRTNLNRYVLMLRPDDKQYKAHHLAASVAPYLELEPIMSKYHASETAVIGEFLPSVLVGVDDIPTRWEVQEANPHWLGIGATTHWEAMASFHQQGFACARCLHACDDPANYRIPTVAFVSFFSGLLLASYFVRAIANGSIPFTEQYVYMSPLRAERIWRSPVAARAGCATCRLIGNLSVA